MESTAFQPHSGPDILTFIKHFNLVWVNAITSAQKYIHEIIGYQSINLRMSLRSYL